MSSDSDPNVVAPSTDTSDNNPSSYLLLDDELNGFFDDDDDDGTNLNGDDFLGHIQDDDDMMTTSHTALHSISLNNNHHHVPSHHQNSINHVDTRQVPYHSSVHDEPPRTAITTTDEDDIIIDGTEPTLPWHNVSVDRPLRQAMIRIITTILKARKKETPTREWLARLPVKARKLERRLYHSTAATSLAEYHDPTTLKQRLLRLVQDICHQHQESRTFDQTVAQIQQQQQLPPLFRSSFSAYRGNSITSQSSIDSGSVTSQQQHLQQLSRSSFRSTTSTDSSLQNLRDSMDQKATIESITARIIIPTRSRASSTASSSKRSTNDNTTDGSTVINNDKKLKTSVDATDMPAPRQRQQPSAKSLPNSRSNSVTTTTTDQQIDEVAAASITEQHRQQQRTINARLQEQISVNLKLQQEIMRKLQQTDQQVLLQQQQQQQQSTTNHTTLPNNNTSNVQQQQQQYEPLSVFTNVTDFGSNQSGYGTTVPNAISSGRSPLSFPQQQPNINPILNPNPLFLQQQQQLQLHQQQPTFLTDNNSNSNNISMYNDADVIRNRLLLQQQLQQQHLQQQQHLLSFGGLGTQFPQQNQYNALLQQQKLMSNLGMSGRSNLGMGPPNFSLNNSHNLFTPQQQQVAMSQMQFMNHPIPSTLSNNISSSSTTTTSSPPPPVQMNSLSETSVLSSVSLTSSSNQPPPPPPPPTDDPLNDSADPNDSEEPLDTFDWWK